MLELMLNQLSTYNHFQTHSEGNACEGVFFFLKKKPKTFIAATEESKWQQTLRVKQSFIRLKKQKKQRVHPSAARTRPGRLVCRCSSLTCAPELLAFDLADALVGEAPRVTAAGATGFDGVVKQVVGQPLQVTVAHEGVLGQVAARETEGDGRARLAGGSGDKTSNLDLG